MVSPVVDQPTARFFWGMEAAVQTDRCEDMLRKLGSPKYAMHHDEITLSQIFVRQHHRSSKTTKAGRYGVPMATCGQGSEGPGSIRDSEVRKRMPKLWKSRVIGSDSKNEQPR
jgi:hypothetical protein